MSTLKRITLGTVLLFVVDCALAQAHDWLWVVGNEGISHGNSIARDSQGNIYIVGEFSQTANFGTISLTSAGSWDVFVAKLDQDGNWLWVKRAGGSDAEWGESVTVDDAGNIYLTGSFYQTAAFGTTNLTSAGGLDTFIAKLDTNGNWLWARRAGGTNYDEGFHICSHGSNSVYTRAISMGRPVLDPPP